MSTSILAGLGERAVQGAVAGGASALGGGLVKAAGDLVGGSPGAALSDLGQIPKDTFTGAIGGAHDGIFGSINSPFTSSIPPTTATTAPAKDTVAAKDPNIVSGDADHDGTDDIIEASIPAEDDKPAPKAATPADAQEPDPIGERAPQTPDDFGSTKDNFKQ